MYLRPASWAAVTATCSVCLSRMPASLISIGRLMPAITSTLARSSTEIARLDGRAAEHVGQQHHAVAALHLVDPLQDLLAALLHVVFRPDADGRDLLLLADHMLERREEFGGQPAVGDQNHADH